MYIWHILFSIQTQHIFHVISVTSVCGLCMQHHNLLFAWINLCRLYLTTHLYIWERIHVIWNNNNNTSIENKEKWNKTNKMLRWSNCRSQVRDKLCVKTPTDDFMIEIGNLFRPKRLNSENLKYKSDIVYLANAFIRWCNVVGIFWFRENYYLHWNPISLKSIKKTHKSCITLAIFNIRASATAAVATAKRKYGQHIKIHRARNVSAVQCILMANLHLLSHNIFIHAIFAFIVLSSSSSVSTQNFYTVCYEVLRCSKIYLGHMQSEI